MAANNEIFWRSVLLAFLKEDGEHNDKDSTLNFADDNIF
jgi:hypothetical protein